MNSEKKKVLVIDDHLEIRELVDITLRGTEFDALKAPGGKEGIQIAREQKPDLILLDIMMPKFDGYMTCKVLKRITVTKDIPIIFLTAKKTKEDIKEALRAGGSDYIAKPFSPSELLTRLRRISESHEVKRAKKIKESKEIEEAEKELPEEKPKAKFPKKALINITRYDDVVVFSITFGSIVLENCQIFRDAFANSVSEGIFKVVLDTRKIKKIDGSGLGLLISVNESLKNYDGELRITFPIQEVNNQFSFISFNTLFQAFDTPQEAIGSFHTEDTEIEKVSDSDDLNVCLSCTFVNDLKSRYCSFCGTNLVLGKGEEILNILGQSIARKIISEAQTNDIQEINRTRNIKSEELEIPSEFSVEIHDKNIDISYKSNHTDTQNFKKKEQIAIQAPVISDTIIPVKPGMQLHLVNPKIGAQSKFDTKIDAVNMEKGMIFVHYSEDAKVLHSQKNFSVALKLPISVSFIVPTFQHAGEIFKAKILELSRLRMIVFSEENIPLNQCMAIKFHLPDVQEISSPLVIAQKGKQKFMYDIEFKVIDEKESSTITQYMYKRQIELVKGLKT